MEKKRKNRGTDPQGESLVPVEPDFSCLKFVRVKFSAERRGIRFFREKPVVRNEEPGSKLEASVLAGIFFGEEIYSKVWFNQSCRLTIRGRIHRLRW
jgi:hypothetical protein